MKTKDLVRTLSLLIIISLFAASLLDAQDQVSELAVWHRQGQTFLTWKEVNPPEIPEGTGCKKLRGIKGNLHKNQKIQYTIYRSGQPITSVDGLQPVGTAQQLSCWNTNYYGVYPKDSQKPPRYAVKDGEEPLSHGTGVYVHNPKHPRTDVKELDKEAIAELNKKPMKAYYAVTYSKNGEENKTIADANSVKEALEEIEGQGIPVLQRIVKPAKHFVYINGATLHYYVRWEAPPNSDVENFPIDYLVAIPPNPIQPKAPVGLHLHCWGASLNGGYGWWYQYFSTDKATTYLISSNQIPYDWWTGYHELYHTVSQKSSGAKEKWQKGVVHPYSTTRMISFLDWAAAKYPLDMDRVFTAGSSMGGSGAPMFTIRYSDRIAWGLGWVGVHDPAKTPQFKGSYEGVYGRMDWGVKFEDGTPVFDYYKDAWFLRKYPKKEIGFITWANGKNDGQIGWPQAFEFFRAMQETKRPHIFLWGMSGHGQRTSMPAGGGGRVMKIDIRLAQSVPAFTRCSLDNNPGTASLRSTEELEKLKAEIAEWNKKNPKRKKGIDKYDGDSTGQVNLFLTWKTEDIVDEETKWEMSIGLTPKAPKDECTADLTPRRLQKLKANPGDTFKYTNTSGGQEIQSGDVKADENGLITIEQLKILKAGNRISITRK